VPLQRLDEICRPLVHEPGPHAVPLAYSRQAPLPSQTPVVPQLLAPASEHWFRGSIPAGTGVQVPANPARLQERQPPHCWLQQTPCWQSPVPHSAPPAQVAPVVFLVQVPPMQKKSVAQSLEEEQAVRQVVPVGAQLNASQELVVPGWQVPAPSQRRLLLAVPSLQTPVTQVVPGE
jgi:hypothetical protein